MKIAKPSTHSLSGTIKLISITLKKKLVSNFLNLFSIMSIKFQGKRKEENFFNQVLSVLTKKKLICSNEQLF